MSYQYMILCKKHFDGDEVMNYIKMNAMHKKFMCSLCNNEEDFKWEDTDLIDF